MASKLSDARKSLQRAKESAQERLKQLDSERRELKSSIKQLDVALKALRTDSDRRSVPSSSDVNLQKSGEQTPAGDFGDESAVN
jgi:uncharacterized coiled-coil DUF342 family protein